MASRIFTDPVHGSIVVDDPLLLRLIQQPEVQRLRRIRQLGIGHLVFPGAEHSRFGHALGAMSLMTRALNSIQRHGTVVTTEERTAASAAALLHDLGHGPFSHTLESVLIDGFQHESMSRGLIDRLNKNLGGALSLTLDIFDNAYHRPFFHFLVSSQLDMDRLDYLARDSYYTGVAEGTVGVSRLLDTVEVKTTSSEPQGAVAFQYKSLYPIENFLLARRLMYWQVYLHKAILAGDFLLSSIFHRARQLMQSGADLGAPSSESLAFFLRGNPATLDLLDPTVVDNFVNLDDSDIHYSLKSWARSSDKLLAELCSRFVNRRLFRTYEITGLPAELVDSAKQQVLQFVREKGHPDEFLPYFCGELTTSRSAYSTDSSPILLVRNQQVITLESVLESTTLTALTQFEVKSYICAPKEVELKLSK